MFLPGYDEIVGVRDNILEDKQFSDSNRWVGPRALCRIKLLPVTHVLVDTWMLTVNQFTNFQMCLMT